MTDKQELQQALQALAVHYAAELPAKLAEIESRMQALLDGKADAAEVKLLHRQLHSLHGSAKTFGFPAVSEAARELELLVASLPADSLVLQLRETDAVSYLKQAKALAEGLHALHCKVALVQFGCALNPLNTLRHLAADYVKLDASFTRELGQPEQLEGIKTLLAGLHAQNRLSITPAVETASALSSLWQAGVNYIQGHYLQSPAATMNYDFAAGEE